MNLTVRLIIILTQCVFLTTVTAKSLKPNSKIVGGHEARPHSHPYLVSLQTRFLWVRVHACGGVILNERWVLSAAHCAVESWLIRWLPLDVVSGIHDVNTLGTQAQVLKISERVPHPLYEGGIGPYDIAVFKTMSPFKFTKYIQPVNLPNNYKFIKNGGPMKIAGWGVLKTTVFIPDLPSRLQEVKVTYLPYNECYEAIEKLREGNEVNPLDKDANICTGPTTGGVAACSGDSGGPLIQYVPYSIVDPNDPLEDNTERYNASKYNCNKNEQTTETEDIIATTGLIDTNVEEASEPDENPTTSGDEIQTSFDPDFPEDRQHVDELIPIILGVVSWGVSPCGEKGAPTIYTNVSTYIDFINYNIKDV